jgi:hypothetical protein
LDQVGRSDDHEHTNTHQEFTMKAPSFALTQSLAQRQPADWVMRTGQAVTLCPRAAGVLRVTQGRAWATIDLDRWSPLADAGDHFVVLGQDLHVRAGQRVVLEAWPLTGQASIQLQWLPVATGLACSHWQSRVVEPLHDLGRGLALVARASARLLSGLAGYGDFLLAGRGRVLRGLESNAP